MRHWKFALLGIVLLLAVIFVYQSKENLFPSSDLAAATDSKSTPDVVARAETSELALHRTDRQFSFSRAASIPADGVLKQRGVSRAVEEAQRRGFGDRTPLLNEVIRLAPTYFPPSARVISEKQVKEGDTSLFRVNLSQAFANPEFWRGKKDRDSVLALHALARNVAFQHGGKGIPLPVQFVIEGKRVDKIGAFDTSQPLPPDKIIAVSRQ